MARRCTVTPAINAKPVTRTTGESGPSSGATFPTLVERAHAAHTVDDHRGVGVDVDVDPAADCIGVDHGLPGW